MGSVSSNGSVSLGVFAEFESVEDAITTIIADAKISISAVVNTIFFMRYTSFFALTSSSNSILIPCKRVLVKHY